MMRKYTREAIEDKFTRILGRGRIDRDKELLRGAGLQINNEVLKAFLVGRLATLIYDMVASLEAKPASQRDREEIIHNLLPRVDNSLGNPG